MRRARSRWVVLLPGLVPLVGGACAGEAAPSAPVEARETTPAAPADWPIFRGDAALSGRAAGALPAEPRLLWRLVTGGAITSSPVVADGRVYIGSDDGKLHAAELASGRELWSFATEDMLEAPPLVVGGRVFVGSADFFFYALDAVSGALLWKHETDDKVLGGANAFEAGDGSGTRVVVGSYDTRFYCFAADTGALLWTYETGNYVNGTPAVIGERIVFGGCDAILHVVSGATGEALAQVELGEGCHVAGSVALDQERAYLGHYGNAFVCVDHRTGEPVWTYPSPRDPFFSAPALGEDRVVFGGRDKRLHCADRATGAPLWTFETRRKVDASPVISGDSVVFGSGDGRLYIVGLQDGAERWSYELGQPIFSSPAVVGGRILVGCHDGVLYAFGAEGATVAGRSEEG